MLWPPRSGGTIPARGEHRSGAKPASWPDAGTFLRQVFTARLAPAGIPVLVLRGFVSQSHPDLVRALGQPTGGRPGQRA